MGYGQRQQCYADEGVRMNQSEEESYFFHEESWGFDNNNHHKQHPAMHMNKLGASEHSMQKQQSKLGGMFQGGMHSDHGLGHGYAHHGGGKSFPFGGSGGGGRFNSGGQHHEYLSEHTEYEESYTQEHGGAKLGGRHHQNNWGGETCYANAYDKNRFTNMNYKPHQLQWTAKGV